MIVDLSALDATYRGEPPSRPVGRADARAYWGAHMGVAPLDLHVNAGVSAATSAVLVLAAALDRPA